MCRQREQTLRCDGVAASKARRLCAQWLSETVGNSSAALDCIGVASVVVSELVTNAVNAACRRFSVRRPVKATVVDCR